MDLLLTDEQAMMAEVTRKFLEATVPMSQVRRLAEKEPAGFERDWWQRGAELGWTSLLVPEARGGGSISGNGLADLAIVAEEMGRVVSPGPFLGCNLAALALGQASEPPDGAQDETLSRIMSGELVAAWCGASGVPSAEPGSQPLTARPFGDGFVISGVVEQVEAAIEAGVFLVTARTGSALTQFLVPADLPGITTSSSESLDLVRRFGRVVFDEAEVPASAVLGHEGEAGADVVYQQMVAVVLQCAEIVGAIDHVFDSTLAYAFDRYSFGRALASYQALKHRFADMKLWLEASHATAGAAAGALRPGAVEGGELASVAKSYIGDRAPALLQECVQLHGGIGVTWDHELHLYLRRVVLDRSLFGTPSEHRERIASMVGM